MERRGGRELGNPSNQDRSRGYQALSGLIWHHFCRQEVALAGSQQLRAQDPAPVRRCWFYRRENRALGTEGKKRSREDGNENGDEDRIKGGAANGDGGEGGWERDPGIL